MDFDFSTVLAHDLRMSARVKRLLAQAHAWASAERGRQSQLAAFLGVSRHAISAWFREYQQERPRKGSTAEQALALQEFLKIQEPKK